MPLTPDDRKFLKSIYLTLQDNPLASGDPLYQPVYSHPGCDDPVRELERTIDYAQTESLSLFSGFRGSGKTTELFRLKDRLEQSGYVVLYGDALEFINPAAPVDISLLLIALAGAFGEAVEKLGIPLSSESYWTRFQHWLTTDVQIKEIGVKAGVDLKLELRSSPSLRQKLAEALNAKIGELGAEVRNFFAEGIEKIREFRSPDKRVVFLFDSLEQIRGSISNERDVIHSVELLFSNYLHLLKIPYLHVVCTVPPWLKFVLPGLDMVVLPCLRLWNNDPQRSSCDHGTEALRALVEKRFTVNGLNKLFGEDTWPRAMRLIDLCGGHFRDLLLLLRQTILQADSLPVADSAIDQAILHVRSNFLPIALDDAIWLAGIEKERATVLKSRDAVDVNRLTLFLDTHLVLYIRNGEDWYDVHPLVRGEVAKIARANAAMESK